jgi:hypothetical protein
MVILRQKVKVMVMEKTVFRVNGYRNQRGTALVLALFLITVMTVLGTMVLNTSIVEIKMAQNQKISSQVFYAAEAGLERGLLMLITDFENDTSPWGNSNYAGWAETVTESTNAGSATFDPAVRSMDMYLNSNDSKLKKLTLGGGHTVDMNTFDLYIYKQSPTEAYVMSYAHGNGGIAAVEYHLRVSSLAPYDNAIFTNHGIAGHFNGSVNVAGSIYSHGTLDIGANVKIANNYQTGHNPPSPGDTLYDLIIQETDLDTKVRVKGGDLLIGSASTQIGDAGAGNAVEGIYVEGVNEATSTGTHYADNWETDVPNLPMPNILDGLRDEHTDAFIDACIASEGYAGNDEAVALSLYEAWTTGAGCWLGDPTRGVVIGGDIVIDKNTADFSYDDGNGNGLFYTAPAGGEGLGEIKIQGTVVINGDFVFGDNKIDGLLYEATGANTGTGSDQSEGASLVVNGNFTANGEFYPPEGYLKGIDSPTTNDINSLGVVAIGNVDFEGHNDDTIAGFFFCNKDSQVNFNKQVQFAGTVIADLVNYAQVPDVYQVPNLKNYLPPAIPGSDSIKRLTRREWRRVY